MFVHRRLASMGSSRGDQEIKAIAYLSPILQGILFAMTNLARRGLRGADSSLRGFSSPLPIVVDP